MLLASDDNNREFVGARNPDDVLWVTFYTKAMRNEALSKTEGSAIFQDEKFVRIMIPGRSDLTIDRLVEPSDPYRFPRQWAQFQNQNANQEQVVGTPVAEWPIITRAQAEELRAKKFFTVQQIAECSDDQITALGMNANQLRVKARAFVSTAKNSAVAQEQAEELRKRDEQIASMQKQMAEMMAMMQGQAKPEKKRREWSPEAKAAAGARLKAAREAKKATGDVNGADTPPVG